MVRRGNAVGRDQRCVVISVGERAAPVLGASFPALAVEPFDTLFEKSGKRAGVR
ncbi:MAG: hypothetical protein O8C63_09600 [Candidatus Methanoperedens sp.]|nr:hypothetical protein [Candidatus Methanoperedens sp.]